LRILIAKFSPWSHEIYQKSEHPEYVAIRNIISQNSQHNFILVGMSSSRYEHFDENGVSFYNIRSDTRVRSAFSFFFEFELAFLLRPAIIVVTGATNLIPFGIASILTRARFIPLLTNEIWYSVSEMPKPLRKISEFLLRAALQKAYAVLAISESVKKETRDSYGINSNKVLVYKYRISTQFNPDAPRDLKLTLNPTGPIVLTVARIFPGKGLIYLVEAARIVANEVPTVKFIVKASSSDERYEGRIRNLIHKHNLQQHFMILGGSPYSEMPKYMSAADVFVLPSISEGLGLVILEALATGVPVVASRVGGIPDILIHEHNGLLVEPRDAEGLAEAIVRILSDEKLRKRLREGGLTTIRCMKENDLEILLSRFMFNDRH
jgi:glycosyltransferase involved in cell wall biosynthesis